VKLMQTSEIRQNKATKQWVIYAPARSRRPEDFHLAQKRGASLSERDENCPFCPGNEHMLSPSLFEIRGPQNRLLTKVVPNKFPALTPEAARERTVRGIYVAMPGYGHHEVVIESPFHNRGIGLMSREEVGTVIEAYHRRYVDLMSAHETMMVIIFRNHGQRAGTSLVHPHSQIITTGMVPHYMRWREEEAQYYFDEWGRCVYCDILKHELGQAERIVHENTSFAAFVPFAAEVPFEMWIMPKKHTADFGDSSDDQRTDLAAILQNVMERLHRKLGNPDYNYIINTSARYRAREPQLHWYLQIRPRLTTRAGFEIGSGININPSIPEEDAEFLRSG
jgi:UDPglucose--hexose-1-phosphate uridylyltransferase